tara:strand:- start:59 stop:295 length:237 start_codon:yes stop_codon:yes gene_type:complete
MKARKLKAKWAIDVVDDLQTRHGSDVEKQLVDQLVAQIAINYDQTILDMYVSDNFRTIVKKENIFKQLDKLLSNKVND